MSYDLMTQKIKAYHKTETAADIRNLLQQPCTFRPIKHPMCFIASGKICYISRDFKANNSSPIDLVSTKRTHFTKQ